MAAEQFYDRIGAGYSTTRQADPRIQQRIHRALGDAGSVVNVGAGAGSYEPRDQILHVAFGFKYDIGPAQRLGLRTAWVNRKAEQAPGPEQADYVWNDLWPLAGVAG